MICLSFITNRIHTDSTVCNPTDLTTLPTFRDIGSPTVAVMNRIRLIHIFLNLCFVLTNVLQHTVLNGPSEEIQLTHRCNDRPIGAKMKPNTTVTTKWVKPLFAVSPQLLFVFLPHNAHMFVV